MRLFKGLVLYAVIVAAGIAAAALFVEYPATVYAAMYLSLVMSVGAVVFVVRDLRRFARDRAAWEKAIVGPAYPDPREPLRQIAVELFPHGDLRDEVRRGIDRLPLERAARLRQGVALKLLEDTGCRKSDFLPARSHAQPRFTDVDTYLLGISLDGAPERR